MNGGTRNCAISQPLTRPGNEGDDHAGQNADSIARNGGRPSDVEREIGGMGRDHRGQAHHEAERQIDAGGDDDESLAEREQQRRGREDADRLQIVDVEDEARAIGEPRPDLEEHDQDDEEQPRPQLRDPHQQGAPALPWGGFGVIGFSDRGKVRHAEPAAFAKGGRPDRSQIGGGQELL